MVFTFIPSLGFLFEKGEKLLTKGKNSQNHVDKLLVTYIILNALILFVICTTKREDYAQRSILL